jgi:L-lactate dehydrogenase complex protein LldE
MDQLFPQTAVNMVKVLRSLGCKVQYNPNQTCCGQPAFNAGFWAEAKAVGEKFIEDFKEQDLVVCPSGSCVGFVRNQLSELFDPETYPYKKLRNAIMEFSDFLVNYLKKPIEGARFEGKVAYHDACGALRECGIKTAPRHILRQIEGLSLIELPDAEVCCGFGGTFAAKFEPISVAMAEEKVENAMSLGAEYLVSTDISCLMHLQSYIDHQKLPIKTLHLADLLAKSLGK